MTNKPTPETLDQFAAIVGETYALRNKEDVASYVVDARGRYTTGASLVLRPKSVEEVSAILKLATETGTTIVPQGGNTGLVGGGIPVHGEMFAVILSLARMNRIIDVDPASNTIVVEAGAILQNIQDAADNVDRLFPLSLGSQGSCQIGGNIGTNAGGTGVLAYGNTRDLIMGLEVVLPTGEIWNGLSRLRKDNTGYDLKNLFVGAEGTLGVVTKAVLKLFPKPAGREVAFVGLKTPVAALELLNRAKAKAGNNLTGFEFMCKRSLAFTVKHAQNKSRHPFEQEHEWAILIEISSGHSAEDARQTLEIILESAFEDEIIDDAVIANSVAQQNTFWQLREDMSHAQKPEGASIKHDVSVPVGLVPTFIERANPAVEAIVPGCRIVDFGHMGDGNLHYNVSQPVGWDVEKFFEFESKINEVVYAILTDLGGSISAEHGIGQMKRKSLAKIKDPVALSMMKRLKAEFDPSNVLNPGKIL